MDLRMDAGLAEGYTSASQVARRLTEPWAERNLFCPACPSDQLRSFANNTAVIDLRCERCDARYQLKAKAGAFGRKAANSAFSRKMEAINAGRAPHYAFLNYGSGDWLVRDLFVVPGHFFTPALIEERKPLAHTARRAGWVGSNILLHLLPAEARVVIVAAGKERSPVEVRRAWGEFAFLKKGARGGWAADVLGCVRTLQRETGSAEFTSQQFYTRFERELSGRHPDNRHIQDKVRQQLQLLRDGGVLKFVTPGRYRVVG